MWYLVCWGQCEGTTSSPNVTQEEFLVPSLLSFCVFTEVLASSCCSFSSAGRQVRGSDIMKQNRDSTTESQAPWVLDSVLLSLVMWSWAHCLTLLKPKNKVLLYTSRVQAGDSRPLFHKQVWVFCEAHSMVVSTDSGKSERLELLLSYVTWFLWTSVSLLVRKCTQNI